MTTQEAAEKIWDHFIVNEGPPSVVAYGDQCLYRGPGGAKCAVGVLIPDDLYDPEMENVGTVGLVLNDYPRLADYLRGVDTDLLRGCQSEHDAWASLRDESSREELAEGFLQTFKRYGVDTSRMQYAGS